MLLHGVYGSAWVWAMKGGVHITARDLISSGQIKPAILAMPSDGLWGDGSGYLRHTHKDFSEWIVSDVPNAVAENISGASIGSPLCIGGLSMGGFGALMLGCQYPEKFTAISAHSAITKFEQMAAFVAEPLESFQLKGSGRNAIDVIKANPNGLPAIRFDCGVDDDLLEANRELHKQLVQLQVEHIYQEFAGEHQWTYWQANIARTLRFFDEKVS